MTAAWIYWLICAVTYFVICAVFFHQIKDALGLVIIMLIALLVLFFLLIGTGQ